MMTPRDYDELSPAARAFLERRTIRGSHYVIHYFGRASEPSEADTRALIEGGWMQGRITAAGKPILTAGSTGYMSEESARPLTEAAEEYFGLAAELAEAGRRRD